MAKKYLSLERLKDYDELIKDVISAGDDASLSSAKSYTDAEVSKKADKTHTHAITDVTNLQSTLSTINTNITNITGGTTIVKKAEYATSAGTASEATHATSADSATTATSATSATKATQDGSGNVITSTYETKTDASAKLAEAKTYADSAATKVKNDLLNGAGTAYDTLKELGELIDDNADAIDALETIASGKADAGHGHEISDVSGLQSALDGKAASSHGTHVTFDTTNKPVMDGTAAFGTSSKVARADHVHPTDTTRASKSEFDTHVSNKDNPHGVTLSQLGVTATTTELNYVDGVTSSIQAQLDGKSASGHGHDVATTSADGFMSKDMVAKLNGIATGANKTTVDTALSETSSNPVRNSVVTTAINSATSAISANTSSISSHSTAIANLQTAVSDIQDITPEEIQALFA